MTSSTLLENERSSCYVESVLFALFRETDPFVTRMLQTCTDDSLDDGIKRLSKSGGRQACTRLREIMKNIPSLRRFANTKETSVNNFLGSLLRFYPWSTHALELVDVHGYEHPGAMLFSASAKSGVHRTQAYFAVGEYIVHEPRISLQSRYVILHVNEGGSNMTYDEVIVDANQRNIFELNSLVVGKGKNHFVCIFKENNEWNVMDDPRAGTIKLNQPLMEYCTPTQNSKIDTLLFYRRIQNHRPEYCRDGRDMLMTHIQQINNKEGQQSVGTQGKSLVLLEPRDCSDDVISMQRQSRREKRMITQNRDSSVRDEGEQNSSSSSTSQLPAYKPSAFIVEKEQWLPPETVYCGSKDRDPWQVPQGDVDNPDIRRRLVYSNIALKGHRRYRENGTLAQCAKVGLKMAFRVDKNMF